MPKRLIFATYMSAALALAGCGDAPIKSPTEPETTGTDSLIVTNLIVTKWSGDGQSATVGSSVAVRPSVRATRGGRAVSGVSVSFEVADGGGSVTGGDAVTNADGIATVGAWVLGEHPGANALSAKVDSTTLVFSASALAGPPATIVKTAGDDQGGWVGDLVIPAPAVRVEDAYGNPLRSVVVIFSAGSGGGQVLYGATQLTDDFGAAQVGGWKLGPEIGPNTLYASVVGLPPATFTAVAVNSCADPTPYALGSTASGTISSASCRLWDGEYSDRYSTTAPAAASMRFDMTSGEAQPHVSLFDTSGEVLAPGGFDNCDPSFDYCYAGGATSLHILLTPGDYVVGAGLYQYDYGDNPIGGAGGSYELSSVAIPEDVSGCDWQTYIVPGVTTTQRVESTDCKSTFTFRGSTFDYYSDTFWLYMEAGTTYTISMSSEDFDTYLQVGSSSNDDFGGSTDSRITYTSTSSRAYLIQAATHDPGVTGAYTLTVELGG